MPSLYAGLANAALEGCAAGLPAILSHAANVDGIVQPGDTGWEVPTLRPTIAATPAIVAKAENCHFAATIAGNAAPTGRDLFRARFRGKDVSQLTRVRRRAD